MENCLKWARRIRCAYIETPFDKLAYEMALFADDMIEQFQERPREYLSTLELALSKADPPKSQEITLIMTLKIANQEKLNREFRDIATAYEIGGEPTSDTNR